MMTHMKEDKVLQQMNTRLETIQEMVVGNQELTSINMQNIIRINEKLEEVYKIVLDNQKSILRNYKEHKFEINRLGVLMENMDGRIKIGTEQIPSLMERVANNTERITSLEMSR